MSELPKVIMTKEAEEALKELEETIASFKVNV